MPTRGDVVHEAESFVGTVHVNGYDQPNPFSRDLGRPAEAWCGDFVTDVYKKTGVPLPSMQPGCKTGFAYCPDAVAWAHSHGAVRSSWQAQPGDIALFDWNANGVADHTELIISWANGTLTTVGGNSGPDGGVNRHTWNSPQGTGNPQVLCVLNVDHAVHFASAPVVHPPAPVPAAADWYKTHRLLMLKSRLMHGADVTAMQHALIHHGHGVGPTGADGFFGPHTRDALMAFQHAAHLQVDGIRGPATFAKLGA